MPDDPSADRPLPDLPAAQPRADFLAGLAARTAVPAPPQARRTACAVIGTAALAGALGGGIALGATGHLPAAGAVLQGSRTQAVVLTAAAARVQEPAAPRQTESGRDWTDDVLTAQGPALRLVASAPVPPASPECVAGAEERIDRPIAIVDHARYDGVPALVLVGAGPGPVVALVTDPTCSRVLDRHAPAH